MTQSRISSGMRTSPRTERPVSEGVPVDRALLVVLA